MPAQTRALERGRQARRVVTAPAGENVAGACEKDKTGQAVAKGVRMLREASLPSEALGLGVGHWDPKSHLPEAGRQVVLAALDAGLPEEARRHLTALENAPAAHAAAAKQAQSGLEQLVSAAEELARTTAAADTGSVRPIKESPKSSAPFATSPTSTGALPAITPEAGKTQRPAP